MNTRIFDAFDNRERAVTDYMAGCGMKYGMDCTCGPECRCKNCPIHSTGGSAQQEVPTLMDQQPHVLQEISELGDEQINVEQPMDFFGMAPPNAMPPLSGYGNIASVPEYMPINAGAVQFQESEGRPAERNGSFMSEGRRDRNDSFMSQGRKERNASILSYGNGLRGMSITSETTFGRAMSGLSALSIDWENLDDFDLEVDHSAHINNNQGGTSPGASKSDGTGPRRPSIRRSSFTPPEQDSHVSFKI